MLIVDHDDASRVAAESYLVATARWQVRSIGDVKDALAVLGTRVFDAILVNLSRGGATPETGLSVLEAARAARPNMQIVVVGDHDDGAVEIDCMQRVASVYLARPQPMLAVERALRGRSVR